MQSARPLHDWVAFIDFEELTEAGLLIQVEKGRGSSFHGQVVDVGPGRYEAGKLIEPRVKKGDKITIHPHGEIITVHMPCFGDVEVPGRPPVKQVHLVREQHIICVIEEEMH